MNRLPFFLLAVLLLLAPACRPDEGAAGHAHGAGGHSHAGDDETPTVSVTRWTQRSELFLEYPELIAGKKGRAAVHITNLADFSALGSGEVVLVLGARDGRSFEFRGGTSQPGIFGVDVKVETPGSYLMMLRVESPDLEDVFGIGAVTVHPADAHLHATADADGETISFLKEQQWKLDFGTVPAEPRTLRSSITALGEVQSRAGGDARLAAPVSGRIDPATVPAVPGTRVRKGTVLTRILPRFDDLMDSAGLRVALVENQQRHELAERERDRVARLVDARALPAKRLEEAEAALAVAAVHLEAAQQRQGRFDTEAFTVRAPFDGVVSEVRFSPGANVEENQALVRLVDPDRIHIVGAVPESRASLLASVTSGELLTGDLPLELGAPISIGRVIDPVTRTSEVRFALDNRDGRLRVGESTRLRLFIGDDVSALAVPETAIIEDEGRKVVFVQTEGESFEQRPVTLGAAGQGYVHLLSGVEPGERVVHEGAYLVRLAGNSTQAPSHGHVH